VLSKRNEGTPGGCPRTDEKRATAARLAETMSRRSPLSPARSKNKPLSPGGYLTPWRLRLVMTVLVVSASWALGAPQWGVLILVILLVSVEIYWRRRL
jgi:hypothetical protein